MARAVAKPEGEEKRQHQRLPLSIPIFVRGADENGKEFLEFAIALNVSAGGILLSTRRTLSPRVDLALEIPVPPLPSLDAVERSVRSLKARVVRVTHGPRSHEVGLKFSQPLEN